MLNFQAWLESPSAIRGILIEAGVLKYNGSTWVDTKVYLSNIGYLTKDSLTSFLPIIIGGAKFTESISIDGSLSMSFGDLELANYNGEYDDWLDSSKYIWVNKPIQVYYGDPTISSISLSDIKINTFEKIFDGIISDIDTRSRDSINIKVRDKLERLNTPITETKIGSYGTWAQGQTNQDSISPIVFGEVFNISPILVDPSTLQYRFNTGVTEGVIEIRDNGVPITPIVNLTTGTFVLTSNSAGAITASIQGIKQSVNLTNGTILNTYKNSAVNLIALIVLAYGNSISKLTASDLDLTNLATFDSTHTQSVGIPITERVNVLDVCTQLASSIGLQLYFNRYGLLQILKLGQYTTDPIRYITDSDILFHSLEVSSRIPVTAATKLGYCRDYTLQDNLLTNIPPSHKDIFSTEWYTTTIKDEAVKTTYSLYTDPTQKDTLLLSGSEATAEAARLNNMFKVPRTVYKMTCSSKFLSLKLGQEANISHNRYGLTTGKSGQVITVSPNWLNSTVDIEVLI